MIAFLRKYWITHAALVSAVIYYAVPVMQAYVNAHPKTSAGLALAAIITAFHSSAPKDQ